MLLPVLFATTWSAGLDLLETSCGKAFAPDVEALAPVDRPWADEVIGVNVRLTPSEVRLEGRALPSLPALAEGFDEVLDAIRSLRTSDPSTPVLLLAVESKVAPSRVIQVLRLADEAGFGEVRFLARGAPNVSWTYPDPGFATELDTAIHRVGRGRAQLVLSKSAEPLARACPAILPGFQNVAIAAPANKCEVLVRELRASLPSCPVEVSDRVVTIMMVPAAVPYEVAAWSQPLDPDTPASPRGKTWKKWAKKLQAREGAIGIGE